MKEDAVEKKPSRYMVRPPRNLSSHFERRQEAKARAEEERKRKEEEKANAPVRVVNYDTLHYGSAWYKLGQPVGDIHLCPPCRLRRSRRQTSTTD